jgi:hypothetical protein
MKFTKTQIISAFIGQGVFRHFIPLVTDNVSLLIEAGIEPKVVLGCQACRFNYRIFSTLC